MTTDGTDCARDLAKGARIGLGGFRTRGGAVEFDVDRPIGRDSDDSRLSPIGRLICVGSVAVCAARRVDDRAKGARIGEGGRKPGLICRGAVRLRADDTEASCNIDTGSDPTG
jgi:hypothetical protein